jgi:hypothetical protein
MEEKTMMEPKVYFQMGISDDRYIIIMKEVSSILKTKEPIGTMLLMLESGKLRHDEQLYAAFEISKAGIEEKLASKLPALRSIFGK